MLMMPAFLADQSRQLSCKLFQAVWIKSGSKRALWERMRSLFKEFAFESMQMLYHLNPASIEFAGDLPAAGRCRAAGAQTHCCDTSSPCQHRRFGKTGTPGGQTIFRNRSFYGRIKPMRVMQVQHFYNSLILKA